MKHNGRKKPKNISYTAKELNNMSMESREIIVIDTIRYIQKEMLYRAKCGATNYTVDVAVPIVEAMTKRNFLLELGNKGYVVNNTLHSPGMMRMEILWE